MINSKKALYTAILSLIIISGCSYSKAVFKEEKDLITFDNKNVWTDYKDAKWSDNYYGLKMEIEKVYVTDKRNIIDNNNVVGENNSFIGIKFKMDNTANETFFVYPNEAKIITSTGEEIDYPDRTATDDIGGEIDNGTKKEGNVIWDIHKSNVIDIKWVKFEWDLHKGSEDYYNEDVKTYSVKVDLVK